MNDGAPHKIDLLERQRDMIHSARGIFLDWDGCLALDDRILPSARTLLSQCANRVVIISNNSTMLPEDFARILKRSGVVIPPQNILLAGPQAVRGLVSEPQRILMYGSARLKTYALSLGIRLERDRVDTVLLMRDPRFSYAKLLRAVNALHQGARLVAANGDRTHPAPGNRLVPETGALLAALRTCVPDAKPEIVGKPSPLLFMMACEILGVAPNEAVMIGDNPETDGDGAVACGIESITIGGHSQRTLDELVVG